MKRSLACSFCLFVILATQYPLISACLTPLQNNGPGTLMLFARQAEDPVHIVQASFGADNMLIDARLENKSKTKVQAYRLGWVAVKKQDVRMGKGELVNVPENVDTTAAFDIPGQGNAKEDLSKHPTGVVFYIAELQFHDGTRWEADPKKMKKEAVEMLK